MALARPEEGIRGGVLAVRLGWNSDR